MSIPTSAPVPTLLTQAKLSDWARELTSFLTRHFRTFIWPELKITLANGASNNVDIQGGYLLHIGGPTGAFNITGFKGGSSINDVHASGGRQLIVHNASSGTMTISNNNAGSQVGNRILTFGGDIITSIAVLVWSSVDSAWLVVSRNP